MALEEHADQSGRWVVFARWRRSLVITFVFVLIAMFSFRLAGQEESGWRISPKNINIQAGDDRLLQLLDESAQEIHGAEWSVDDLAVADVREENGRAVVHAKAPGTVRIGATLNGEKRSREIKIWPQDQPMPMGTTTWGTHPIGREIGDISAVPTPDGPSIFSLEQTANGKTYLRGVRDDGIQIWNWLMPETTRDVDLVCGDWLGGALISANRSDSYTLYTVGNDGKLRWQHTLSGIRKAHAYNREHVMNVLSQSADGFAATVSGLDQATGEKKFDLTIPASHEQLTNLRRSGTQLLCAPDSSTSPVRILASRLFVNIDDFAYVAFTEHKSTLTTPTCKPGAAVAARDVSVARDDKVVLWQIHPDGTYRSTIVEESKGTRALSEPVSIASPTGGIIPDDSGGVLLSIRKSAVSTGNDVTRSTDEFVYRLNYDGDFVYKLLLPRYDGKLHDEMVLGQENVVAFATRGGTLVAFNVQDGKEVWRWDAAQEIEVFAALANGDCLVQTPTAVVDVENSTTSRKVMDGKVMMDWQGHMYRKHN
jgi:outer membrane protein assembly factor BamB